jgi:putative phosphoesterase
LHGGRNLEIFLESLMKIGVVSDTHGLFRPEIATALAGVEQILHLGDVGKISVLNDLEKIAPVTAVRGNVDREGAAGKLPETEVALIADRYVYMLHNLDTLHLDPAAGKFAAVLYGHTHVPNYFRRRGVLYFNPGSCGPRRFRLPVSVGLLSVNEDGEFSGQVITLDCD